MNLSITGDAPIDSESVTIPASEWREIVDWVNALKAMTGAADVNEVIPSMEQFAAFLMQLKDLLGVETADDIVPAVRKMKALAFDLRITQ